MALLTIAGVQVANPTEMKVGRFDLTKASRTASGKMVMEIIATKRRLDCSWKLIKDADLQTLIDTIIAHKPFFQVTFPGPGGVDETMTAYSGDINASLWHRDGDGVRWWEDVSISLIEQ